MFAVSPISRYRRYLYVCATAQRNLLKQIANGAVFARADNRAVSTK